MIERGESGTSGRLELELPDTLTSRVARFAAALRICDIPPQVLTKVKLHILDTLGCMVAGRVLDVAQSAREFARQTGSGGGCLVFGTASRFTPTVAALANGVIANALDYDDGFERNGRGMGHPGASILPAALAALGDRAVDGPAFLVAVTAAYEINNRLILAVQPTPQRFAEVYGNSQHQAIGAAVAYGTLVGLDARELVNAIGLAGSLTSVPSVHKYNWLTRPIISLKDFVAPAAQAGVQAVMMSRTGFVGSFDILDGPTGYWRMIGSDNFDPSVLIDGIGHDWLVQNGSFKIYPACRWLAPALEAFETAFQQSKLSRDAIETIEIRTFGIIAEMLMQRRPLNAADAQMSLPFTIGAIAMGLAKGVEWFSESALAHPVLLDIAARVRVTVDPAMDALMKQERRPSAEAVVIGRDGSRTTHRVNSPLGSISRPIDDRTVVAKAAANFGVHIPDVDAIVRRVLALEAEPDVENLIAASNPAE